MDTGHTPGTDAIVLLADAVNQLAMVVEEVSYYAAQHGYTDVTMGRRRRWQETVRKQRELIAELIPSGEVER